MPRSFHAQQEIELTISHLGGMGDGVAYALGKTIMVPFTCPGDYVRAVIDSCGKDFCRATVRVMLAHGPGRQTPPCAHFGACGGCAVQHVAPEPYRRFKRDAALNAVRRLGYPEERVADLVEIGEHARRRVEFKVSVHKGIVSIGLLARRSHRVIDLAMCPVTRSDILALLPAFRKHIADLGKPANINAIHITDTGSGLDVMLTLRVPCTKADQEKTKAFAEKHNLLRLTAVCSAGETMRVAERYPVQAIFGDVRVDLPPRAFLQATEAGQQAITNLIVKYGAGCTSVAELYSGCGTYSFPLAKKGRRIAAYEGDAAMVAAMHNAIRRYGMDDRISIHCRDLMRTPLTAEELKRFDAVVINPPRNGALPQMRQLAKSGVQTIIVVSCNPATFERDAVLLRDSGYDLTKVTPIDQFVWSHHLELVAIFHAPALTI